MEVTSDNFRDEVLKSDIPVIVDFWAAWCGPCMAMKPVFERVSKEYEGKLKFAKLDTESCPDLAQEYEVRSIPCMIIFHKGKEADRIIGYRQEDGFRQDINKVLKSLA